MLEEIVSAATARKLRGFSMSANKSTGTSHPSDAVRWHEFVVSVIINKDKISIDLLKKWLIEDGWSEVLAVELAIQFEDEIEFSKVYRNRIGA